MMVFVFFLEEVDKITLKITLIDYAFSQQKKKLESHIFYLFILKYEIIITKLL